MNPWRGLGGLPKEIWVLVSATLVNRMGTMALPFLVLYLTRSLGFSAGRAGFVMAVYGAGALFTSPLAGKLCDRVGALRIMRTSLFLSGATLLVFPGVRRFGAIIMVTLLWAVMSEAFRPASMTHITELVAPAQRKAAFALYRLAINLGMSVGPAVGGFLATVSFPALFFIDGATSLLAGVVLTVASRSTKGSASASAAPATHGARAPMRYWQVLSDRHLLYLLAALLPVGIVFFQHTSTMALFLVRHLRMSESFYGLLFLVNTALIILFEVPLNIAIAHWSHRRTMALGAFLTGAGFGALALARDFFSVALTVVVWTFGEMLLHPGSSAYVAEIAPAETRGAYMGLFLMSFSVAFMLSPWIGTEVLEWFGPRTLWSAAFLCGCLSTALLARVYSGPRSD